MNIIKKTNEYGVTVTKPKHLIDEPGIPELLNLYKDVYNPDTGKYDSMSEKSKAEYFFKSDTFLRESLSASVESGVAQLVKKRRF